MGHDQDPRWPVHGPIQPAADWRVGITFAPFTEDEWQHFTWSPSWRVQIDQAGTGARGVPALLVAVAEDDASVDALLPFLPYAWGIELGNEPAMRDPAALNAWYSRMIPKVRNTGFGGPIITAGVANLNTDTLVKAKQSIAGLWPDIVCGWHAYDNWRGQINLLLDMLEGRPHLMTEWGIPAKEGTEDAIEARVASDLIAIRASGAQGAFWYQMHDGEPGTELNDFGVHAYDGHWRRLENALRDAA